MDAGKTIQLGFVIPVETSGALRRLPSAEEIDRALGLIAGRFDSAWTVDHLQFGEADVLEGFTALTWYAARHPRLRFGNAVLCQSFRNPAHLAKMAATLQNLSGGRFILGLGACWHPEEFAAYGYEFPPAGVRVDQLREAVQIIGSLWREETTTFRGQHCHVTEARCLPRPLPAPPIMIGAFGPRMLRLAVELADWWNVSSTGLAEYRAMAAAVNTHCAAIGRDPASLGRSWIGACACAVSEAQAMELAGGAGDDEDFSFVGTPDQVLEQMSAFVHLGVDTFIFDCAGFPDLSTLQTILDHISPRLFELAEMLPYERTEQT
ncbi:MAG: LLM class flavin-dependent oxidoreductase [Caldilineales bacterium]